jgi:undecaprenyl-phosphate 4-deoxy-4-formamido-L-arabinose transferase
MDDLRPGISVVIPAYNSGLSLPELVKRLSSVLQGLGSPYELIVVNDGSKDNTGAVAEELTAEYPAVHAISLMRNYGQHNALLCGIRAARYDTTVTMDDDLQHPPEEIPKLLEALGKGADVVYGAPASEQHGIWRNLASEVTKLAFKATMSVEVARDVSAFRAFRTQIRDAFSDFHNPFVSIDVLLSWGTNRFAAVRVRHDPRRLGVSNYTFRKLMVHALNMMTGFSTWPLRLASLIGFSFTLFGFAVLVFVLGRFVVQGTSVPGFPFLASLIAIFSGAQLLTLGIIGEYLARMYTRTMDRPAYVVRSTVESAATLTRRRA